MHIDALLHPMSRDAFLQEHWQRKPFTAAGHAGRFAGLIRSQELAWLLQSHRLGPPTDVLLVKGSEHYARRWTYDDGSPRVDQVQTAWRQGYTLVVNAVHRYCQPIARLAGGLEEGLHHPVAVNLYFTPPASQGFVPHYDVMDAFILQIEGRKIWQVREPVVELPFADEQHPVPEHALPPVVLETELAPGSVLYLPRGFIHAARTTGTEASLHLTVGVQVVTWLDLLAHAVRSARGDRRLRQAIEPGFFGREELLVPTLEQLLGELPGLVTVQGALHQLAGQLLAGRPRAAGSAFAPGSDIDVGTLVRRAAGALVYVSGGVTGGCGQPACLRYPGGTIMGPAKIASALRYIGQQDGAFAAHDLPDDLGAGEKLVLVRRLLREGLLEIVPGTGGNG